MFTVPTVLRRSAIHGVGVFAVELFPARTIDHRTFDLEFDGSELRAPATDAIAAEAPVDQPRAAAHR